MINVLIPPTGTEIGHEIWLSFCYPKAAKLFLARYSYDNHARYYGVHNPILPYVNENGWRQTLRASVLLYDIHFIFPAHGETQTTSTLHQTEISAKTVSFGIKLDKTLHYKCQPMVRVQDITSVYCHDNFTEETESWSVFIKPDAKKCIQSTLKIHDKSTLEIQLCDTHDLSISAHSLSSEYTVDCFTHKKYGDVFCKRRLRKEIQARLSSDLSFLYGHHNAPAPLAHASTAQGPHVRRRRMGYFWQSHPLRLQ